MIDPLSVTWEYFYSGNIIQTRLNYLDVVRFLCQYTYMGFYT